MLVLHILFAVTSLILHGAFALQSIRGTTSKTLRNTALYTAGGTILTGAVLFLNAPAMHAMGAFILFFGIHGVVALTHSRKRAEA